MINNLKIGLAMLCCFFLVISNVHGAIKQGINGMVVIEAEDFVASNTTNHYWSLISIAGSSESNAVKAGPKTSSLYDINYSTKSPRLDFSIEFTKIGTHYIWLRGIGYDPKSNSVHLGLNGKEVSSSDRIEFPANSNWSWTRRTMDKTPAVVSIPSAGTHTVNLWMRESGVTVDKIVITTDPAFSPAGLGPTPSVDGAMLTEAKIQENIPQSGLRLGMTVSPAHYAKSVMTGEEVKFLFDSSKYSNISAKTFTVKALGNAIDGTVKYSDGKIIFTPTSALISNLMYSAYLQATGTFVATGKTLEVAHTWQFTTLDPSASSVVFYNDMNDEALGLYTISELRRKWNTWSGAGIAEGRVSIVPGNSRNQGSVMRIRYEAGKFGLGAGGVQWRIKVGEHDDLYASYWIKFSDDFNFVKGGKLPGLAGGKLNTGGRVPDGTDGWSARMVWGPGGSINQYAYYPGQTTLKGKSFPWDIDGFTLKFRKGEWHKIETRIKVNTPGKYDGIMQSWLDGNLALDLRDMRFRDIASLHIDTLLFSSFFGGASSLWATTKTEYAYFDNVVVSTKPITH